ncbi:aldo/keto reductase [Tropicimonas marinistellae]|uniref:aldo/keto reductase n=1 Tax=Tropicimonas marinistellae TaxID=1739787 RepID=UPI0008312984|nr:aldo/keto reductase [Tropicimonas marinistellae]
MTVMPTLTLNDGNTIPQLGFGIWHVPPATTSDTVKSALGLGYRLVDGAFYYSNETEMGEGLRASGVSRDEVFLTSKIWNGDHGAEKARASVERSLKSIGVDTLDLVLIHWPVPSRFLYVETWQALVDMRQAGLTRSIGVSNFNADHLERIIAETGVVPALNQIEVNPTLQQPELRAANEKHGILTQSWTPLGNGRSFDAEPITAAAARAGKSPAQVILRWHLQLGNAVITRSENPARQAENLDVFDFALSDSEMAEIATLDLGLRTGPDPSVFRML